MSPEVVATASLPEPPLLDVPVRALDKPLQVECRDLVVPAGTRVSEIVARALPGASRGSALVLVGDQPVPAEYWHRVRVRPGVPVLVRAVLRGGGGGGQKNPLRTVLMLAVTVAAFYAGPLVGSALFGTSLIEGGLAVGLTVGQGIALTSAIGSGLITLAGTALVNAIAPAPRASLGSLSGSARPGRDSPTLSISGQRNRIDPFGPVPVVLGRFRFAPPYGARPFTEVVGADQYLRGVLICMGPVAFSDYTIGDTPIEEFDDVELEVRQGFPDDPPLTLVVDQVSEGPLSVALEPDDWQTRTTALGTDEISIDISALSGLVTFDEQGSRLTASVHFDVQYAPAGTEDWEAVGSFVISDRSTAAVRKGVPWKVARGQYDVRIRRTTPATGSSTFDDITWTALRSIKCEDPLPQPGMAKIAYRIRANGQLNGIIDEFKVTAQSIVLDWDEPTGTWIEQATSNPASLARAVAQGPITRRPLADADIDFPSLQDFHESCAAAGFSFNAVIDFKINRNALLADIFAAGRASRGKPRGKFGVVRDRPQTVPRQVFTPRNSWSWESEITFRDHPHALRIRYPDEDRKYADNERIVYAPGYDADTATRFEPLDFFGVTRGDLIDEHGRFQLAQSRARPEVIGWNCDIEHLGCGRGDLVHVAHDVLSIGLGEGRIKTIVRDEDGLIVALTLDARLPMESGKTYGFFIRRRDMSSIRVAVQTVPGETATFTLLTPLDETAERTPLAAGDLAAFGETDRETMPLIVLEMERRGHLSARLFGYAAAPEIYDPDGPILAYDPFITRAATAPEPPEVVAVNSGNAALIVGKDGTVQSRIVISIAPKAGPVPVGAFEGRFRPSGIGAGWSTLPAVPGDARAIVLDQVEDGALYDIEVRATGLGTGKSSAWVSAGPHLVVGKTAPPPAPTTFTVQRVSDGTRRFAFGLDNPPADVRVGGGFQIRYALGVTSDWSALAPLHAGLLTVSPFETNELAAGEYTFACKVVDSSGIESSAALFSTVTLGDQRLSGVLAQYLEQPDWPGTKTGCYIEGGVLKSVSVGGWEDLPATWDALPDSWDAILPQTSPIAYETPVRDLGSDLSFTPFVSAEAIGAATITMKTGTTADGTVAGAWGALAPVSGKRYVQFRIEVAGTAPQLTSVIALLDGQLKREVFEDVDTSTETASWFENIAAGHFRVGSREGAITAVKRASLVLQSVGAGWTWELVSKAATVGGHPAAEFKVYDATATLAAALVDVDLQGPASE